MSKTPKRVPAKAPAAKAAAQTKPATAKPVAKAAVEAPRPAPAPKPPVPAPAEAAKPAAPAAELKAELLKTQPAAPAPTSPETKPEVKPAAKAEPVPAPAVQKGKETMTDTVRSTTNEATDRAQAMFGEMNARAKDAMEKGTKLFQELGELNKGNIEAVVESTRRAAKGVETITQNAAEYARASFERQTAALKGLAAAKSPTELLQLQSDFARSAFDSFVAETSKNSEAALKIAGDVFQPISNRFAVAAEKLKSAA